MPCECECTEEVLEYKVGDTQPRIEFTYYYYDDDGVRQIQDITGFTFELHINFSTPKSIAGAIVDAAGGKFDFPLVNTDLDEAGLFKTEVLIKDNSIPAEEITFDFAKLRITERIYP
jgi:hypothetical protein